MSNIYIKKDSVKKIITKGKDVAEYANAAVKEKLEKEEK